MKKALSLLLAMALLSTACNSNHTSEGTMAEEEVTTGLQHPEWSRTATLYELNIRQFSQEGTFRAIINQIPRLKNMGIDCIWLMPIHPIGEKNRKGTLGSYYSVKDYKGLNPMYGTEEDFRALVQAIHVNEMKVIIDWVANHSAWDNPWVEAHPEYYKQDSTGNLLSPFDWTDVVALNYENDSLQAAMIDAMSYWVSEFDIDGFRCDVAGLVPTAFWNKARKTLDEIKPVFMLAEDDDPKLKLCDEAFDMSYGWEFHHLMNTIAQGKDTWAKLDTFFMKDSLYPADSYRMSFITNHDENSWNGTVFERLGDNVKPIAALYTTIQGMPLMYSGQEAGMKKRLEFFDKDAIEWGNFEFAEFYTTLFKLKKSNEALHNGSHGAKPVRIATEHDDKVYCFIRQKGDNAVLVAVSLANEPLDITLNGTIPDDEYTNVFSNENMNLKTGAKLSLPAHGYAVFTLN